MHGYFLGDPDRERIFLSLSCSNPKLKTWCKHVEIKAAVVNQVIQPSLPLDENGQDVNTGDYSNFAMPRSPCLVVTVGSGTANARMVATFDTGATHNVMSKRAFDRLKAMRYLWSQ